MPILKKHSGNQLTEVLDWVSSEDCEAMCQSVLYMM